MITAQQVIGMIGQGHCELEDENCHSVAIVRDDFRLLGEFILSGTRSGMGAAREVVRRRTAQEIADWMNQLRDQNGMLIYGEEADEQAALLRNADAE
jgi:hypothetical protein